MLASTRRRNCLLCRLACSSSGDKEEIKLRQRCHDGSEITRYPPFLSLSLSQGNLGRQRRPADVLKRAVCPICDGQRGKGAPCNTFRAVRHLSIPFPLRFLRPRVVVLACLRRIYIAAGIYLRVRWPTKLHRECRSWALASALFPRRTSATRESCTTSTRAMLLWHSKMASCGFVCVRVHVVSVGHCARQREQDPLIECHGDVEKCDTRCEYVLSQRDDAHLELRTRVHTSGVKTGTGVSRRPGTSEATIIDVVLCRSYCWILSRWVYSSSHRTCRPGHVYYRLSKSDYPAF